MTPELETLDQLLGGTLPVAAIRALYPDGDSLRTGLRALLESGDIRLVGADDQPIAQWRWRELLTPGNSGLETLRCDITEQGAHRIA
jgi:hypothetical protein